MSGRDARNVIDLERPTALPPMAATHGGLPLNGGFAAFELAACEEAIVWATRLVTACRSDQELSEFAFDPRA